MEIGHSAGYAECSSAETKVLSLFQPSMCGHITADVFTDQTHDDHT